MVAFTFRNVKYESDLLKKLSAEGHKEAVDKELIVAATGALDEPPVAIKVDGQYHLLQGSVPALHNKPTITVITKFTLKKCKVDTPQIGSQNASNQSFQSRWNDQYSAGNQRSVRTGTNRY